MLTLSVSSLIGNICLEINIDNDDKITLGLYPPRTAIVVVVTVNFILRH
jgi:hypothetical protein